VKPRIFIGSSGSAKGYASAIHAGLAAVAECTVWTDGAFALSTSTIAGLLKNLRDSDFGIFVFAPDDTATIKGELLNVPRDNVVYEAGLFSGYLCPERSFIVVPQTVIVRVPTDLLGMTLGFYEDDRTDGNDEAAVATFCSRVQRQIAPQGLFKGAASEELRELAVRFECCQSWMADEVQRVAMKKTISAQIETFCKNHPLNKHRLLVQRRTGYYLALLASIRFNPEPRDWELILALEIKQIPAGFAYFKVIEAIEELKNRKCATPHQLKQLHAWVDDLPDARKHIASRIDALMK
jgi:hypothetical protein